MGRFVGDEGGEVSGGMRVMRFVGEMGREVCGG